VSASIAAVTVEVMKSRASVRRYENRPVPREVLEEIVDCGRLAPSGGNQQAWVFVVVTDPDLRRQIAGFAAHGKFVAEAPACVAVFCGKGALCEVEDACAATENMIIAAWAHGIGSCWINSHRKAHSAAVEELLRCPETHELVTMFALGYPADDRRRPKKTLEEVLRWETF